MSSRHRQVLPGFHWIQECGSDRTDMAAAIRAAGTDWYEGGRPLHLPQNIYLLIGERTLLFDTLSPAARGWVVDEVEAVLDGRPLDFLALSHPDVPHAGNTHRILRRWPGATLVAPRFGGTHELYHLEGARLVGPGDTIDLGGGLRVRFHEATFLDHAMHLWMTEESTGTLFPVDWLGFLHMGGECLRFSDEIETPVTVDRLVDFHGRVMFWFQYVDVERVNAATRRVWETFRPELVAPAHGLVVRRDPEPLFRMMEEVVARVAERGRTGVA